MDIKCIFPLVEQSFLRGKKINQRQTFIIENFKATKQGNNQPQMFLPFGRLCKESYKTEDKTQFT